MATLKDLSSVTSEVDRLGAELHTELTEGDIDFQKMVGLADMISEKTDRLAQAFSTMGSALDMTLNGAGGEPGREDEQ